MRGQTFSMETAFAFFVFALIFLFINLFAMGVKVNIISDKLAFGIRTTSKQAIDSLIYAYGYPSGDVTDQTVIGLKFGNYVSSSKVLDFISLANSDYVGVKRKLGLKKNMYFSFGVYDLNGSAVVVNNTPLVISMDSSNFKYVYTSQRISSLDSNRPVVVKFTVMA